MACGGMMTEIHPAIVTVQEMLEDTIASILDLTNQLLQANHDKEGWRQDANDYRHGIKEALALFDNEARDAPDCCELMAAALKNALKPEFPRKGSHE